MLWHTEVEGLSPAQVAPILGLTANGVAALAYRAREGLRQAYLQQHLAAPLDDACRPYSDRLGAYARGGLSKRETAQVEEHLDTCAKCRELVLELSDVGSGMRAVVAPLILGLAVAGYLSSGPLLFPGAAAAAGTLAGAGARPARAPLAAAPHPSRSAAGRVLRGRARPAQVQARRRAVEPRPVAQELRPAQVEQRLLPGGHGGGRGMGAGTAAAVAAGVVGRGRPDRGSDRRGRHRRRPREPEPERAAQQQAEQERRAAAGGAERAAQQRRSSRRSGGTGAGAAARRAAAGPVRRRRSPSRVGAAAEPAAVSSGSARAAGWPEPRQLPRGWSGPGSSPRPSSAAAAGSGHGRREPARRSGPTLPGGDHVVSGTDHTGSHRGLHRRRPGPTGPAPVATGTGGDDGRHDRWVHRRHGHHRRHPDRDRDADHSSRPAR